MWFTALIQHHDGHFGRTVVIEESDGEAANKRAKHLLGPHTNICGRAPRIRVFSVEDMLDNEVTLDAIVNKHLAS